MTEGKAVVPDALDVALKRFLTVSDDIAWNRYTDFDWSAVNCTQPHPLSAVQIAATKTALMVEDHIPGFATEYMRLFPVDESVSPEQVWKNRQTLHFIMRWISEEDRHAHVLELYLRETNAVDQEELTQEMVHEGVKHYSVPHEDPSQLMVYTTLQEKATQLFYACLGRAIDEPVLESVLKKLAQDESRHCGFFTDVVRSELQVRGDVFLGSIKESMEQFSMPLYDMLDSYKRQAINMIRTAKGYDAREAFIHMARIIERYVESRTDSRSHTFEDMLRQIHALVPAR